MNDLSPPLRATPSGLDSPEIAADPGPDLLEYIAAPPSGEAARRLTLESGRVVEVEPRPGGEDRVTIRGAGGEVELSVLMSAAGPVLRFRSADLELSSTRDLSVRCDTFSVKARRGIVQETAGNLRQRVGGDADVKVRGELSTLAGEVRIEAKQGPVQIEASDDVEIIGERVKLNC